MPNSENHGGVRPGGAPDGALCRRCNYPLRGLGEARCPECGTEFDPNNPTTMIFGRRVGRVERFFIKPPGKWLTWAAGVAGLLTIASASAPGWYFQFAMYVFLGWIILGVIWLVRLVGWGIVLWRRRLEEATNAPLQRWFAAPAIAAVTIFGSMSGLPEWMALWLSRPAMDRLAAQRFQNPSSLPRYAWVGLFPAEDIEAVPGGVRFLVRGSGFLGREGYAYYENGIFQGDQYWRRNEEPISGFWFKWSKGLNLFIGMKSSLSGAVRLNVPH